MDSSSHSEGWRILPFANKNKGFGPSKMFFRFSTSAESYGLYITDLVQMWEVCDTRKGIIEQARRDGCTIDPSEDASQFDVLMTKLRDGLSGERGGRCKFGGGNRAPGYFSLFTRTPLPAPLKPLRWKFHLSPWKAEQYIHEIVLPALTTQMDLETQVDNLKRRLEEKDHVITRLMDKIEQSSIDLSLVFPGFGSGRKGLNAKQATKVVPGIAMFDQAKWSEDFAARDQAKMQSLIHVLRVPSSNELSFGDGEAFWVDTCHSASDFSEDDSTRRSARLASSTPPLPVEESTEAFESWDTQTMNRHPKKNLRSHDSPSDIAQAARDSSSSSSDGSARVSRAPKSSRLVRLGGGHSKPPPPAKDSGPAKRRTSTTSSATVTGSDSDSDPPAKPKSTKAPKMGILGGKKKASCESPSPPPPTSSTSTPSRRLGTLGGKKSQSAHHSSPHFLTAQASTSTISTPSRKLGILGDRHQSSTPQPAKRASQHHNDDLDATDSLSSAPSPSPAWARASKFQIKKASQSKAKPEPEPDPEPEPEPELTAEEIADRKREELKRTLKAGGEPKKKRKF